MASRKYSNVFTALVKSYATFDMEFPALRAVSVAQWLLESGRGQSRLAQDHLNFAGLKWRPEMEGFATPVAYEAHDGEDRYCAFETCEAFISGYWRFLDRAPYAGWREVSDYPEKFIRFIGPIYTPTSLYADNVIALLGEASRLLIEAGAADIRKLAGTHEPPKPAIKEFFQSPNHSSRDGSVISRIIMHYTTSRDVDGTISWFQDPASQRSAHYVIGRDGAIFQMVADSEKAWHAKSANRNSIGIEHSAAPGDGMTALQEAASIALVRWLASEYKIPKTAIVGHCYTPENLGSTDCPHSLFGPRTQAALASWVEKNI